MNQDIAGRVVKKEAGVTVFRVLKIATKALRGSSVARVSLRARFAIEMSICELLCHVVVELSSLARYACVAGIVGARSVLSTSANVAGPVRIGILVLPGGAGPHPTLVHGTDAEEAGRGKADCVATLAIFRVGKGTITNEAEIAR